MPNKKHFEGSCSTIMENEKQIAKPHLTVICNLLLMNNQGCLFKWRTFSVPSKSGSLFLFHPCLDNKPDDGGNDEGDDDEFDVLGILADLVVQLVFGHDGM